MPALVHRDAPSARSAFTLVEMLLVVAIIAILVAIGAPYLGRSVRGHRLQSGARSIVMLGRYARTMAVLRQTSCTVSFDLDTGGIHVALLASTPPPPAEDDPLAIFDADAGNGSVLFGTRPEPRAIRLNRPAFSADKDPPGPFSADPGADPDDASATMQGTSGNISRSLETGTRMAYVEREDQTAFDGSCQVTYHRNGTCTPYRIRIEDDHGDALIVRVNRVAEPSVLTDER